MPPLYECDISGSRYAAQGEMEETIARHVAIDILHNHDLLKASHKDRRRGTRDEMMSMPHRLD